MYCYLEDRERRVLPSTAEFDASLDPYRTAIACIDMHHGHVAPKEQLTCPAPRHKSRGDVPDEMGHHDLQAARIK